MRVQFTHPAMLTLLLAIPIIFTLMWRGVALRRLTLRRFGVDRQVRIKVFARVVSMVAVACIALALAQPKFKATGAKAPTDSGSNGETVFLLDVSRSMLADDVKPSRLERARQVIAGIANQRPADRIALVAFAGSQSIECTLTADGAFFQEMLKRTGPQSVSRGGTLIADAIRFAMRTAFDDLEENRKQLVILTDGGDLESNPESTAPELERRGIRVVFGGVGSELVDTIVPVSASDRTPVRYGGELVRTHLQSLELRRLAEVLHGEYRNVSEGPMALAKGEGEAQTAGSDSGRKIAITLAAIAFILLLLEALASKLIRQRTIVIGLIAVVALHQPVRLNAQESAGEWARQGRQAFEEGHYYSAAEYFKTALTLAKGRPDLVYNLACALYKGGRYDEALMEFAKASAAASKDSDLDLKCRKSKADALYRKSLEADSSSAEFMLEEALREYRDIIQIRPEWPDAAFNAEVVERRLTEIRRKDPQSARAAEEKRDGTTVLTVGKAVDGRTNPGGHQVVERDW